MITSLNKKVSVVVPNYNYARYINKRIDSILKQTYPIYELIVLDDGSTDSSVEIIKNKLKEVQKNYPGLKMQFVANNKNSGKAMAQWKKGFELASGDYIWIAEADDLSKKKFLEEVMKGFEDPEVLLSYSESMIINSRGIMMAPNFRWSRDKEKTGHYKESYIKDGVREIEEIMAIRCTIPNVSAAVFRNTSRVPYLEILDEALKFFQVGDWYFYMRILDYGKISYCKKSLNKFRVHKDSKTGESVNDDRHYKEVLEMHRIMALRYNIAEVMAKRIIDEEKRVQRKHGIE